MRFRFLNIFLAALLLTLGAGLARAQADASTRSGRPGVNAEDLPDGIKETLAKARLKSEEKEYNEMLERAEEAARLGSELSLAFERNQKLKSDDFKKIETLEKLVRKIRRDLGGKDDDKTAEALKTPNLENAFSQIRDNALDLSEELKKTSRYSISVKAIENSNVLLTLVQFVKSNSRSL